MHVVVAGATGFLGRPLCGVLLRRGHTVNAVSREPHIATRQLPAAVECVDWLGGLAGAMRNADAIVNLAGESLAAKRWTPEFKKLLRNSRVESTRKLVDAMRASGRSRQTLVSASAVGYYGDTGNSIVTEGSPAGNRFLAELCDAWESEARKAERLGARVALPRMGPVLSAEGGMLERMLLPFKLGLGGPIGSGTQWLSWIHHADAISMIAWMVENDEVQGPVNVTAPEPVTMAAFARELARTVHRPALLKAPAFALRLALGEFAESVLTGQRVMPKEAQRLGFKWAYPTIEGALRNLIGKEEDSE